MIVDYKAMTDSQAIAFYYGSDAAEEGKSKTSNCYDTRVYLHKWWELGWEDWHFTMELKSEVTK